MFPKVKFLQIECFVIPCLENPDIKIKDVTSMAMGVEVFGKIYALNLTRPQLESWAQNLKKPAFAKFILEETKKVKPKNPSESVYQAIGETMARKWISR